MKVKRSWKNVDFGEIVVIAYLLIQVKIVEPDFKFG